MGSVPFAFSVHHFINSVGAYAGFAAFLGLGLLALLYFASARETARLREHAYEAAERIQQLEARIAQLVRQPAAGGPESVPQAQPAAVQPTPAPAGVQQRRPAVVAAGVAAPRVIVGAPAGVGAPALSAATKLIPTDVPQAPEEEPEEQADDYTQVGMPAGVPEGAREGGREPVTAAAVGSNGSNHERIPPPASAAAIASPPPRPPLRSPSPAARPAARPASGRRPGGPPVSPPPERRGIPRGFVFLLGGLAIVAVVAVLLIVTSGSNNSPSTNAGRTTNAPAANRPKPAASFNPASVTVAVLNGTSTSGLANRIATKLGAGGYKEGKVTNAADQTQTSTVVAYLPGHRSDALHVATSLKLQQSSVQPIDSSTQAVACPPPGSCTSTVVVTVGSDLASTT